MINKHCLLFVVFLLAVFTTAWNPTAWGLATSQPALSKVVALYNNGGPGITFESTFVCGLWTCDFQYVVSTRPDVEAFKFSWVDGATLNLNGMLNPVFFGDRKLWGLKGVHRPAKNPSKNLGSVTFTEVMGIPGSGMANYYAPPKTPNHLNTRLDQIGDSINSSWSVEENPTLLLATSQVTWTAQDEYEYLYTVANMTAETLDFSWPDSGLVNSVAPNQSFMHSFTTNLPPLQIGGSAGATIRGVPFQGPSITIVPLPEPTSTVLVALSAWTLLAVRFRSASNHHVMRINPAMPRQKPSSKPNIPSLVA